MCARDIDDPDMPLQVLFDRWPGTAAVFLAHRMLCFGCPIMPFHTVTDACLEYGLDEAGFRQELRVAGFAVSIAPDAPELTAPNAGCKRAKPERD